MSRRGNLIRRTFTKKINLSRDRGDLIPLVKVITNYIYNLTDYLSYDAVFLGSVLTVLTLEQREEMINFIYDRIDIPKDEGSFRNRVSSRTEALENVDEIDNLASTLFDALSKYANLQLRSSFHDFTRTLLKKNCSFHGNSSARLRKSFIEIASIFYLEDSDIDLLIFLYTTYGTNLEVINELAEEILFQDMYEFVSTALRMPIKTVKKGLGFSGRLYQSGIIESIDTQRPDFFTLDDSIRDYISGASNSTLVERFIRHDSSDIIPLEYFNMEEDIDLLKHFLKSDSPCNILLYGAAGTGKTEFVRSLIRSCDMDTYFVKSGEDENNRNSRSNSSEDKIMALRIGCNTVDKNRGILVVDEADHILNTITSIFGKTPPREKGWLNTFLDSSNSKIIWISNETVNMEESTQRRFAYSIKFKEHTAVEREMVFKNILKKHPLKNQFKPSLITTLSEEYRVNAGAISSALESSKIILNNSKDYDIETVMRRFLDSHEVLIRGESRKGADTNFKPTSLYDPKVLNTDVDLDKVLYTTNLFNERLKNKKSEKMQMNILLWGLPGTGKTEFVKYLGKKLKQKIIMKRYSDLESKWLGETEQNINSAFREAENSKSILFIDEADSFFTERSNANRSWEVSRTNEFLTQMENFKAILVCCTNLLPGLDKAAMRRFNWKIEFKPLRKKHKITLYKKYFSSKKRPLLALHRKIVENLKGLTPGDLRAVYHNTAYFKADEISHDFIISELQKEIRYKQDGDLGSIGF